VVAECVMITSVQVLHFFLPPYMLEKKERVIFLVGLVGDVVDGNIMNGCNGKIGM